MSWEAWGTPPDPEPNPCPMCDGEISCCPDCPLCEAARKEEEARTELMRLKMVLAHRLRIHKAHKTDEAAILLYGIPGILAPHEIDALAVKAAEKALLTHENAKFVYPPPKPPSTPAAH